MAKTVFDLNNSKLKVIEFLFIFSFKKEKNTLPLLQVSKRFLGKFDCCF